MTNVWIPRPSGSDNRKVNGLDYQTYMASREWAALREAVRKRCNNKCERCCLAPMQATHHITYANLGREPLGDLLGLCNPCHAFLSAKSEIDPLNDGFKVYLAGPNSDSDWRRSLLVPPYHEPDTHTARLSGWPIKEKGIKGGFDFVGPYFPAPAPEGVRIREFLSEGGLAWCCGCAIRNADIVFCWLPNESSHFGSIWELGYAAALEKYIFLAEQDHNPELWLTKESVHEYTHNIASVEAAWNWFLVTWETWYRRSASN